MPSRNSRSNRTCSPPNSGEGLGGTINISLRSGTNVFHGVVFEFMRNDKLDANNFFNVGRARPPFQQNQFGGAVGGPVYIPKLYDGRNRTFFFADYQGTRIRKGLTRIFTVPTQPCAQAISPGLRQSSTPTPHASAAMVGSFATSSPETESHRTASIRSCSDTWLCIRSRIVPASRTTTSSIPNTTTITIRAISNWTTW